MLIREINPGDVESLVILIKQVESESQYMLFESVKETLNPNNKKKE